MLKPEGALGPLLLKVIHQSNQTLFQIGKQPTRCLAVMALSVDCTSESEEREGDEAGRDAASKHEATAHQRISECHLAR